MNAPRLAKHPALVLLGFLLLLGCGKNEPEPEPLAPGQVRVEGVITEIVDQVPVDGGVTITLRLDDDSSRVLLFGSLFTYPPPEPERFLLYEAIQRLEEGDRIRAVGTPGEDGIQLESFAVLP